MSEWQKIILDHDFTVLKNSISPHGSWEQGLFHEYSVANASDQNWQALDSYYGLTPL